MSMSFPPFEPDPPEASRRAPRAFRGIPLRMLAPNILTLLALCMGLTSIRMSFEERFELAVIAIIAAAVLDGLDGRVARILKSTSRFGAELDSLADFVNFGVAPAVLLYAWLLGELGTVGWIGGLIFALCAALRLARFNVEMDNARRPSWMGNFFVGVPAPAGAIAVMLPIYLDLIGAPHPPLGAVVTLVYQLAIAFLMVSRVPTFSGKKTGERVPRDMVLPIFVAVVIVAALLISFPWPFMAVATLAYLVSLPFAFMTYQRMARRHRAGELAIAGDPDPGSSDES